MALSLRTERAFRNSVALTFLLVGLALLAFSLGAVLQIGFLFGSAPFDVQGGATLAGATALVCALIYFGISILLLRDRPRPTGDQVPPATASVTSLFRAGLGLCVVVMLLGILFAFGSALQPDSTRAALLILAGVFGATSITLYRRLDVNVRAAAAIVGFLAGVLLLFAQLRFLNPGEDTGTYNAWEITSLVLPRVFGAVAFMIAALSGLVFAYTRHPRPEFGSFFILSLAALLYGVGVCLAGLAFFFDTPWSAFVQVGGGPLLQLAILTAGTVLLIAGGVCICVASVIGLVRNGQGVGQPPTNPTLPATTPTTDPRTNTTHAQRTERAPPTS
ncbi:MAG: hypothetical protein HYT80_10405 [Euryarchaeota archaeon]|nr:hypothetical protein [Euryarchaeota archaeon]